MPRFYFDLFDGVITRADDVGVELPDIGTAKQAIAMTLPRISADRAVQPGDVLHMMMSVREEGSDRVVLVANLHWTIRELLPS